MANRFSQMAKSMEEEISEEPITNDVIPAEQKVQVKTEKAKIKDFKKKLPKHRRTITIDFIHELAFQELKERLYLKRKMEGEKGKVTDDELMALVFETFFAQPKYKDCLTAALNKINNYE